jgi:NitT/TauT family transport system ATP-binding protein
MTSSLGTTPIPTVSGEGTSQNRKIKISLKDVSITYPQERGSPLEVVRDFNLDIYDREFICLVGVSGCGKSTLLNAIAGLLPCSQGQVFMDGLVVNTAGPDRTMVFQDDAVFPWYTVQQNVEYGLKLAGVPRAEIDRRVQACLDLVGMSTENSKFSRELSGGMRKRVDLARALVVDPKVLLMDEPFGSLDAITKERLQLEFLNIWQKTRMTVVFVTHDLEEAIFLADRVVVMGKLQGRVKIVVDVPLGRPRSLEAKTSPESQSLRRDLAHYLE